MKNLQGVDGQVWFVKPKSCQLAGSVVNLTYSNSTADTRAKFTIDIITSCIVRWQSISTQIEASELTLPIDKSFIF